MRHIARTLFLLGLIAAGLYAFAAEPQNGLSGDYRALQGRWVVMRNEIKKQTTPGMHGRLFIFEGRTFRIDTDQGSEGYSVDESTDPKSIDFDDGRSPVIRGIYKLEKDKLVICTAAPGEKRPTEFKTSVDTGTVLTELKRKHEGAQPPAPANRSPAAGSR
jgi:uncharacterized protein (TIGR03067 family)